MVPSLEDDSTAHSTREPLFGKTNSDEDVNPEMSDQFRAVDGAHATILEHTNSCRISYAIGQRIWVY